ncbi:hypothetical protein C6V08_17170 [Burkholderia gladioli]|nr:hypothetical protein CEJ98_25240 [Burkholderia gladioli pv. gladioli]AWY52517.1 hypothetical protein A8H28_15775 [Burkholderia gladioli pv. gladioli]PRG99904.1 hypothetical protein C6V08_17170 [Burkholderia gladioli]PRH33871.1 hypothetical protein C6V07_21945 [Burkholderia gladioli]
MFTHFDCFVTDGLLGGQFVSATDAFQPAELMREHVWHPPQFATRESWFVAVGDGDFTKMEAAMPISGILASHVRKVMPVMNGEIRYEAGKARGQVQEAHLHAP